MPRYPGGKDLCHNVSACSASPKLKNDSTHPQKKKSTAGKLRLTSLKKSFYLTLWVNSLFLCYTVT